MPQEINESTIALYFNKVDGKTLKIDVPGPREDLTSTQVQEQMDAILAIAELFDITTIKEAKATQRTITTFDVV